MSGQQAPAKPRPTTWADVGAERVEALPYSTLGPGTLRSARGRTMRVVCPFCSRIFEAWPWSLTGTGKRCECGALHAHTGKAFRLLERFQ